MIYRQVGEDQNNTQDQRGRSRGFSLVELMFACAIAIITVVNSLGAQLKSNLQHAHLRSAANRQVSGPQAGVRVLVRRGSRA